MIFKKVLYIDLDDTSADFFRAAKLPGTNQFDECMMYNKDFFFNLKPVGGACMAIRQLIRMGFDVWILTQPLATHHPSYSDKARWVQTWFPELTNKIIMTQDKGLNIGHFLIDDNAPKWKAKFEANGGKFIEYPYDRNDTSVENQTKKWQEIVDLFNNISPIVGS